MRYTEFTPEGILKRYIQCYFTCETDTEVITADSVYANGYVELLFNLGEHGPQRITGADIISEPRVQLWGQTIRPFTFTSVGKHSMLGVRFFTHTAAFFFDEPVEAFNDKVLDFNDVAGAAGNMLYMHLQEATSLKQRISLLEQFLLARLARLQTKFIKQKLVDSIVQDINRGGFFENINSIAARYGISSRYLQKIFMASSGLSPGLYGKITRFQKGLQLVAQQGAPLTHIAYECGYYDQSHFIKDFKTFTGVAPSHFVTEGSTDLSARLNN